MLRAIHDFRMKEQSFAEWGVVGSPRFAGRMITAANIQKSKSDPHFSISPHIIPNFCLHSLSGAASVAFGIRGPNFGVGGGPEQFRNRSLPRCRSSPKIEFPASGSSSPNSTRNRTPDGAGKCLNDVAAHAVAIALAPGASAGSLKLSRSLDPALPGFVRDLQNFIQTVPRPCGWKCGLNGLGSIELTLSPIFPTID